MSERSTVHATFVIERTYDATPARVFKAWAEPEAKASWFGPKVLTSDGHELDFKVGGEEHLRVVTPDGTTFLFDSRYEDIVPDERIVYAYDMHKDDARISVSLTTVVLEPSGTGTKLTFTEQGVFLDGHDTPVEREHGTGELLDNLEAELDKESA